MKQKRSTSRTHLESLSGPSAYRSIDYFVIKANEPRVFHQGKNHPGLRALGQAVKPRPPFAKTQSGSPRGLRQESLPSLFGSTPATRRRKSPLFLLPASFL